MNFYFSTRDIPALKDLPVNKRIVFINDALKKLSVPEKTLLNVFKLLVIVPVFALVLRTASDWTSILWAALIILCYPFFIRPLQYALAEKYLPKITKESM
jgi:hypothetical protein